MADITVTDFTGNKTLTGFWNGRIYQSARTDKSLIKIFVNQKAIHITKAEYERIKPMITEKDKKRKPTGPCPLIAEENTVKALCKKVKETNDEEQLRRFARFLMVQAAELYQPDAGTRLAWDK